MSKYFILNLLALVACTSSYGPQDSGIKAPDMWSKIGEQRQNAPLLTDEKAKVENNWWKHFNDPVLDALINEAIQNNKNLAIAKQRVEEAKANRMSARSTLLPQINGAADATRENEGFLTNNKIYNIMDADIQATWEIDLFGKNQALVAESNAILESQEATQQAVSVSLLAEVARNYFDLRNYERQIAITQQNLDNQRKTLELTKAQMAGAFASNFDVQRAAAQVSTTEAQLPSLQISYDMTANRLNVLLGQTPGTKDQFLKTPEQLQPLDAQVIVAAPATVLATRPDVLAAERQFAATMSAHDSAIRELFPTVNLLSMFGVQSIAGFAAVQPWAAGANATLPILNFGRIQADIDATDAEQQQAFLNYQQTVLQALENMENALTNYLHETSRNASLTAAAVQNRKAVELANQQYKAGYNGLLDLLVVQRNELDAESAQVASDTKLRQDLVNIYTAAGGGWVAEAQSEQH